MALFTRQATMPPLTPEYLSFDIAPQLLAVSGTLTGLALLAFLARAYVRTMILKVIGIDDYIMFAAVVINVSVFSLFVSGTKHGLGRHFYAIPPQDIDSMFYTTFWQAFLVVIGVSFVKLSIAFFLLRLSQRTKYRRFLYGLVVFITVMTLVGVLPVLFRCSPVAASWDVTLQGPPFGTGNAKCMPFNSFIKFGVFNSAVNIATDVLFVVLPIPMVWSLQINTRTKISLVGIFSLGLFACAAAIYKTPLQYHFAENPDFTGEGSWYWVWQIIELTLGIIAACLPALKPLFNWLLETAKSLTSKTRSRTQTTAFKRNSSLGYFKTTSKTKADGGEVELRSVGESEATENVSGADVDNFKGMYSVKVTGEGWDPERGHHSEEAILPLQGPGLGKSEIKVTTQVSMSS